jgi:hypothetical protein
LGFQDNKQASAAPLSDNEGYMPSIALDEEMTECAIAQFVALGVLPETYDRILTFTRLRALRFDFLVKRRLAKEQSLRQKLQEAADLCGRLLAHIEGEDGASGNSLSAS